MEGSQLLGAVLILLIVYFTLQRIQKVRKRRKLYMQARKDAGLEHAEDYWFTSPEP